MGSWRCRACSGPTANVVGGTPICSLCADARQDPIVLRALEKEQPLLRRTARNEREEAAS